MPYLIDTESRAASLAVAINRILAESGPAALSLRHIAQVSRVSTSSILHHFDTKARLIRVSLQLTAEGRLRALVAAGFRYGPVGFIPRDGEAIVNYRVWLAWREIARSDDLLGEVVHRRRTTERSWLARLCDEQLGPEQLDEAFATADGLATAQCDPVRPMRRELATDLFRHRLRRMGVPEPDHAPESSRVFPFTQLQQQSPGYGAR